MTKPNGREKKKSKTLDVSKTMRINIEAAEEAISMTFGGARLEHYNTDQKTPRSFKLWGKLPVTSRFVSADLADKVVFTAVVVWPDGQDGHGSVEVSRSDSDAVTKYACWKNKGGRAKLAEWYEPSKLYEFQRRHGLRRPRNRRSASPWELSRAILVYAMGLFLGWMVGFLGGAVLMATLTIPPPDQWNMLHAITVVTGTLGASVGVWVVGILIRMLTESAEACRWEDDWKKGQGPDAAADKE